jgi:ribonucleoside-diphosphate reductase alpha chain
MSVADPIEVNHFQKYIHISKYSRWLEEEGRRETWGETVTRYMNHMTKHLRENVGYELEEGLQEDLFQSIYNLEVMPSMRAIMTAGPALERSGISSYNCSYLPIDDCRAFDEVLYLLSHGTGVGFSVEDRYICKLPNVPEIRPHVDDRVVYVGDSKEGWAFAYRELLSLLWVGIIPDWDVSDVRPAGAPLKTFGGYASGPEPLVELFEFTVDIFKKAQGRKLTDVEVFDIICMVGRSIVSGGVRRSALICLCDLSSKEMATAKHGQWWENNTQRGMANISAVYEGKPDEDTFIEEWKNLIESQSGERGIFNRKAAQEQAKRSGIRNWYQEFGTNPCGEIFLPPNSFCNLSEAVIREGDDFDTILDKVEMATILGTIQASIDNFPYLRPIWKQNVEIERLLGVSLTGVFSNKHFIGVYGDQNRENFLKTLKLAARATNEEFAEKLGINKSAAVTCIKPSGTVSLLNGCSSGLHPWYAKHYIRSVRGNNVEPITKFMKDEGVPHEPDMSNPDNVSVFYFPMKAPNGAVVREDLTAIEHLEYWLAFKTNWCDHNPSITVQIKPEEWLDVAQWVYKHFDEVGGLSFLPYDTGSYKQAPFEVTDKETYEELKAALPEMDWNALKYYETYDSMDSSRELACTAGACELVDIGETSEAISV